MAFRTLPTGKPVFTEIPLETQKNIIREVGRHDLLSLQRVSRHFFSLASEEIYRVLDFEFASDVEAGPATSRVTHALQTIVPSDRGYALYIRSFRLGTGRNTRDSLLMSRIVWASVGDPSKALNTLLLLMIRKASMIEAFIWDTPIELSGPVYQALHNLQGLRLLRIRLDPPSAIKIAPRPSFAATAQLPNSHAPPSQLPFTYPAPLGAPPTPTPAASFGSYSTPRLKKSSKKKCKGYNFWANGRVFSGFKTLHSLALLNISDLDCLGEISACLKASLPYLKILKLSLAMDISVLARIPPPSTSNVVDDGSDTDPDGEDDELITESSPHPSILGQQVNEADIRKEKLAQEGILAKIFDLQTVSVQGNRVETLLARQSTISAAKVVDDDNLSFIKDFRGMLRIMLDAGGLDFDKDHLRSETLDAMKKAADKYLSKHHKKPAKKAAKQTISTNSKGQSSGLSELLNNTAAYQSDSSKPWTESYSPSSLTPSAKSNMDINAATHSTAGSSFIYSAPSVSTYIPTTAALAVSPMQDFSSKPSKPSKPSKSTTFGGPSNPKQQSLKKTGYGFKGSDSLINFDFDSLLSEHEEMLNNDKYTFESDHGSSFPTPPLFPAVDSTPQDREDSMDVDMDHPDEITPEAESDQEMAAESEAMHLTPRKRARFANPEPSSPQKYPSARVDGKACSADADKNASGNHFDNTTGKSSEEEMRDYIRATHGLQLEELSLYLIPLKASILARAIDLTILKRLTLLSVGPQDAFWLLLVKLQNHSTPISFESIYTDNVSLQFLECLTTFEGLKELFLLERNRKTQPDTSSSKAIININDIRKLALRKHIRTLKRLWIKNENNESWDLNTRAIRLLSSHGAGLVELGISVNMLGYHLLLQVLPGFKSLLALQLTALRSTDRSPFSQLESLSFAADAVAHLPDMKLEYLSWENHLAIIKRVPDNVKRALEIVRRLRKQGFHKDNGKGKAKAVETIEDGDSSDSAEMEDGVPPFETWELGLNFVHGYYQVEGIKIFSHGIRSGTPI